MAEEVDPAPKFVCPVCQEVFKKPVALNGCYHRFCYQCLLRIPRSPDGSVQCPVCRATFRLTDVTPDRVLEREIASTNTQCRACGIQLSLLQYDSHSLSCSKRTVHQFTPIAHTTQAVIPPPNRSTFLCPLCREGNLDCKGLLDHVNQYHANSTESVVCPICASMPWGSSDQRSQNFIQHLNLRHCFEYDTYVDYHQDEDAALRAAIQASLSDSHKDL